MCVRVCDTVARRDDTSNKNARSGESNNGTVFSHFRDRTRRSDTIHVNRSGRLIVIDVFVSLRRVTVRIGPRREISVLS